MHKLKTFYRAVMPLSLFISVLFVVWSWHSAYAAERTRPCAEEIANYCKGIRPGGGRILNCLKEHDQDLSSTCKEKVAGIEKKVAEARDACSEDIDRFCKGIVPGEGRILRCLRGHAQEISSGCSEKIEGVRRMIHHGNNSGQ
jgi:hypothetical protein